jgi:hypothetical protein
MGRRRLDRGVLGDLLRDALAAADPARGDELPHIAAVLAPAARIARLTPVAAAHHRRSARSRSRSRSSRRPIAAAHNAGQPHGMTAPTGPPHLLTPALMKVVLSRTTRPSRWPPAPGVAVQPPGVPRTQYLGAPSRSESVDAAARRVTSRSDAQRCRRSIRNIAARAARTSRRARTAARLRRSRSAAGCMSVGGWAPSPERAPRPRGSQPSSRSHASASAREGCVS